MGEIVSFQAVFVNGLGQLTQLDGVVTNIGDGVQFTTTESGDGELSDADSATVDSIIAAGNEGNDALKAKLETLGAELQSAGDGGDGGDGGGENGGEDGGGEDGPADPGTTDPVDIKEADAGHDVQ